MSVEMQDLESESMEDDDEDEMATLEQFEHCLDACGFGKYQWRLLSISFVGVLAHGSVMVGTPYAFNLRDEIEYNGDVEKLYFLIPYFGMIFSSIVSGFLSDCFGRRRVIIACYAGLAVATLLESVIHPYGYVFLGKFWQGFFLSGAFVASTTLQAEYQTEKSRDRIMVTLNFFVSISNILIVLHSFVIGPLVWNTYKIGDQFELDLWDISTILNLVFCLAACLLYSCIPESPKSDFARGRYKNALDTLKIIYAMNTGKSCDELSYQLLGMTDNEQKSRREQVRATWTKVKLILKKPLLKFLMIIMAAQIIFTFSYNSMRLWHPTLLFVMKHSLPLYSNSTTSLCTAFENNDKIIKIQSFRLMIHHIDNCVLILIFGLVPYIVVTIFINIGKKLILLISLCVCCCCIISIHWIHYNYENTIMFGIFMAIGQLFIGLIQAIVVEHFPVWTKSLALSLVVTASAIGAVLAEVLFSFAEQYGCIGTSIGAATMACAAFFSLFLPK